MQFELDRDIDAAEQDVQAAINAATTLLSRSLPAPPSYSKSNPADAPILTLSVSSAALPLNQVDDFADSILAQKISQVSGVGLVTINGGQKPAVRVQADPEALAGAGLSLEDLRAAIVAANVNQPKGTLDGPRQGYTLATNDQLVNAAGFRPIVIAYKDGAPVRLTDVAKVVDGVENAQLAGWADADRAIILNVQRQPGANVIEVANRVKALLPQLRASLPADVNVRVLSESHGDGARVRRGRGVHARLDDRPRRGRDFRLLAQPARDGDPGRRGAVVTDWHVRCDVPGGLQPRQPVVDGAHDLDRLRGRRRDRDDREHHALHRRGKIAARCGARGQPSDWLHDHLAHGLARGGADPVALHGRRRRSAVP